MAFFQKKELKEGIIVFKNMGKRAVFAELFVFLQRKSVILTKNMAGEARIIIRY